MITMAVLAVAMLAVTILTQPFRDDSDPHPSAFRDGLRTLHVMTMLFWALLVQSVEFLWVYARTMRYVITGH